MKKIVLKEFMVDLGGYLDELQKNVAFEAINLHYVGDKNCNHMVDGKMVAKYPDKECQEMEDAHYNVMRGYSVKTVIQLMSDGTFKVKK